MADNESIFMKSNALINKIKKFRFCPTKNVSLYALIIVHLHSSKNLLSGIII